jgi:hypothetical protein
MISYDCKKMKQLDGYFFHGNKHLVPFDEFKKKAHCIYLHHFHDHSLCDKSWCLPKRSPEIKEELPADYCVGKKFQGKEQHQRLFEQVKKKLEPHFTDEALLQVHHAFSTQKNKSLNKKVTVFARKDKFLGGSTTLQDCLSMIVIEDSLGYKQGLVALFDELQLPVPEVLCE